MCGHSAAADLADSPTLAESVPPTIGEIHSSFRIIFADCYGTPCISRGSSTKRLHPMTASICGTSARAQNDVTPKGALRLAMCHARATPEGA